ncbi:MAG: hypothetical protein H6733_07160 [Alphaproteobacteria bacterium]|nr:hypothetical protein [Alphaproteobacteria bacterium]
MRAVWWTVVVGCVGCNGAAATWQTPASDLGPALLSVTGTAEGDVWTVGADAGDGPLVGHLHDGAWERVDVGSAGDLWWIWLPPTGDVQAWAVGAGGRALAFDGTTWTETVTDPDLTLFGIWGAAPDDVWAVGGDVTGSVDVAGLFHWDGDTWTRQELPPAAAALTAVFKVWGAAADDVWICGANGVVAHYDGTAWGMVDAATERTLLTVAGDGPDNVYAVGGSGNAEIVHFDGTTWTNVEARYTPELNGVYVRGDDVAVAGRTGAVWWKHGDGAFEEDPRGRATFLDLHATWIDPEGGVWAVGGAITALPLSQGVIVYGGRQTVPVWTP